MIVRRLRAVFGSETCSVDCTAFDCCRISSSAVVSWRPRGPVGRLACGGREGSRAASQQGYRVIYREAHTFLEELAEATLADTRKDYLADLTRVPLFIIDDVGMRKLPHTAAEDLLELIMRRYERASTLLTSNRPVEDWGKLLGDTAAVTALLDRLFHHAHVLKCGPRSWRTQVQTTLRTHDPMR